MAKATRGAPAKLPQSKIPRPPRPPKNPGAPTIGIIGGGQLAKMLGQAASQLGLQTIVLSEQPHCPAASSVTRVIQGAADEIDSLRQLAEACDLVTLENEFVDANLLEIFEQSGHPVAPSAATMRIVQDKFLQKTALKNAGLAVPEFIDVPDLAALDAAIRILGLPLVLKKRRNGYDGKGNATIRKEADARLAWELLNGEENALFAEAFCPFTQELAIMITRGANKSSVAYPVVETIQDHHICRTVKAPAPISLALAETVTNLARKAIDAVQGVGAFGVELFRAADDRILINELAPRVHNSGHYTIEACACSQFENHLRAILGWPLGSPVMRLPAAVMINLLGHGKGSGAPTGIQQALETAGAHIHIYGKTTSAPLRKMGHLTILGQSLEDTLQRAQSAASKIQFGNPESKS
jgi:5-(carboxyamino)imidazole ribonucleotide synthase